MKIENAKQASSQVLNRDAVQLDTDRKWNNQKAWPFWYPLVPYPWQETDQLNNGQGLLGIEVMPGQIKDINIITDRDTAYRLLNLKYTVYAPDEATAGADTLTFAAGATAISTDGAGGNFTTIFPDGIGWLVYIGDNSGILRAVFVESVTDDDNLTLSSGAPEAGTAVAWGRGMFIWNQQTQATPGVNIPNPILDPAPPDIQQYYPLTQTVKVGLRVPSLKDRELYGGLMQQIGQEALNAQSRHPIQNLQGLYDGFGMLRTPAIVGPDSTITVTVENTNTEHSIFINGTTFGYKISLGSDSI